MSEQEQHEIIGRTVMEHGEAKHHLGRLEAKARSYADSMRIVAQELSPTRVIYTGGSGFIRGTLSSALQEYPNRSEVEELLEEIRATKGKIEVLTKSLRDMGVTA